MAALGQSSSASNEAPKELENQQEVSEVTQETSRDPEPTVNVEEQSDLQDENVSGFNAKIPLLAALLLGASGFGAYAAFPEKFDELVSAVKAYMPQTADNIERHDPNKYDANLVSTYEGLEDISVEELTDFTQDIIQNAERGHLNHYQVPVLVDEHGQRTTSNGLIRLQEYNPETVIGKTMTQEEVNTLALEEIERVEGTDWTQEFINLQMKKGMYLSAGTESRWANPNGDATGYQAAPSTARAIIVGGDVETNIANSEMKGTDIGAIGNVEVEAIAMPKLDLGMKHLEALPVIGGKVKKVSAVASLFEVPDSGEKESDNLFEDVKPAATPTVTANGAQNQGASQEGVLTNISQGDYMGTIKNVTNIGTKVIGISPIGGVAKEILKEVTK